MAMTRGTAIDWSRAQVALRAEVERVTRLLRSVRNPAAPALGRWNVAEVAMHLSQAWLVVPGMATADLSSAHEEVPGLERSDGPSLIRDIWELGGVTAMGVESDDERDPAVLAERIGDRAEDYFRACSGMSPQDRRPWLVDGTEVQLPTLTCHLLNETIVHGYDIARADGQRWVIEPSHAALVLEGFLLPAISALGPRTMVDQDKAAGLHATYELRIRGSGRHLFVFDDGELSVDVPSHGRIDCYLSVDPVDLLLVAWGRKSQWGPIVRGKMVAWGRRPWLGVRLRAFMRNP